MWRERRVQFKILKDRNRRKLVWKYENSKSLGNSWVLLAGMSKNTSEYHLACEGKKKIQKAYFPYMGESDCPWIWFKLSLLSSIRVLFTKFHFHCFISHLLSTKAELAESRPTTPEANHHRDPGNSHSLYVPTILTTRTLPPLLCLYEVHPTFRDQKRSCLSQESFPLVLRHNLLFLNSKHIHS